MILDRIEPEACFGDQLHNALLTALLDGVDVQRTPYRFIWPRMLEVFGNSEQRWLFHYVTKTEAKRINVLLRATSQTQFVDKCSAFVERLRTSTHYGPLFKKELIQVFSFGGVSLPWK